MTTLVKGFKFRIYPDEDQQVLLARTFGCVRYVYNYFLDQTKINYEVFKMNVGLYKPKTNYAEFCQQLTKLKQEPDKIWLNEVSSIALQQSLCNLSKAFSGFFNKTRKVKLGYPKFKSKYNQQSITLVGTSFQLKDNKFFIAKFNKSIKVEWSRILPSKPTSVTITLTPSGQYFASFICEYQPVPTNGQNIIGIDLGITDLATMSNSEVIANPKHYLTCQKRLARLQRQLSKKQKGSKNRNKARLKVARLHQHIANQRQDHLHKLTTRLVCENQAIVIEDLAVSNLGRNRHLSKYIMTAGWGMFRYMLEYKTVTSSWCRLLIADKWFPSTQLCNDCGKKPSKKIKLAVKRWTCEHCGSTHARDDNASKNLEQIATNQPNLWVDHPGSIILTKPYLA